MLKKTAIAIDPELLVQVDRAAQERGQSRNAFIGLVLKKAVQARRDRDITRTLDALFADASLVRIQRVEAANLDHAGGDWSDERW
jgi:metal-responsive CopG/Arc/MetJ family transcriptional regulator